MHTSFKISENIIERIKVITDETETPSGFAKKATLERLKRMEARDIRAQEQYMKNNIEHFKPIVKKILSEFNNEKK